MNARTARCNLAGGDAGLRALPLSAIIRLAPISIKFSLKWAQHSINRLPRRDKRPAYDYKIVWEFMHVCVCERVTVCMHGYSSFFS